MDHNTIDPALLAGNRCRLADYAATNFRWTVTDRVAPSC